jgi:non-homologous end joining protein Ku
MLFALSWEFPCLRRVHFGRATKLSLVSCPIALYTATSSSERVAFRQINKKTGNRLRQQLIDEESGEPIDPEDKGEATRSKRAFTCASRTKS